MVTPLPRKEKTQQEFVSQIVKMKPFPWPIHSFYFLDKDIAGSHKNLTYDLDLDMKTLDNIRSFGSMYVFDSVFNFPLDILIFMAAYVYQQFCTILHFVCCLEIKGQKINRRLPTDKLVK